MDAAVVDCGDADLLITQRPADLNVLRAEQGVRLFSWGRKRQSAARGLRDGEAAFQHFKANDFTIADCEWLWYLYLQILTFAGRKTKLSGEAQHPSSTPIGAQVLNPAFVCLKIEVRSRNFPLARTGGHSWRGSHENS